MQKATKKLPSKKRRRAPKKPPTRRLKPVQTLKEELKETLEQQTATSEILGVIASSPTDIQPVLDTAIVNAVKLSGAKQGHIRRYDGEYLRVVAHYGENPEQIAVLQATAINPADGKGLSSRAFLERGPIHVLDVQQESTTPQAVLTRADGTKVNIPVPPMPAVKSVGGSVNQIRRTVLAVPLVREGTSIGTVTIWRDYVEAFSERQIDLVKTFADQAVIAIENVRLFNETKEALEQQTATAEILGVIASSPTDVQPVLDVVAERAARLCEATDAIIDRLDGDVLRRVAHYGTIPISRLRLGETRPISRLRFAGRAIMDRQTIHIHDVLTPEAQAEFPESQGFVGIRTVLLTPLLREGVPIGVIFIRRNEVRPFSDKQIALLKTFADQAVIAIENARLFLDLNHKTVELETSNSQLREALEQQTVMSEILGVIASSPTDLQPVLDAVAENAARVCQANDAVVYRTEDKNFRPVAHFGPVHVPMDIYRPLSRGLPVGRALIDRWRVHVLDIVAELVTEFSETSVRSDKIVNLARTQLKRRLIASWDENIH